MATRKNHPSRVRARRMVALQQVERRIKRLASDPDSTVKQKEIAKQEQDTLNDRIRIS